MSKAVFQRILSGTALCAVLGASLAAPFGAWAQANERGGMWSQLRLTERFLTRDTRSSDTATEGTSNQAITELDYSFGTETRTELLTLDVGTTYRFIEGPGTDGLEGDFAAPNVRLHYQQEAASASIAATVTGSQLDLADVSPLSVIDTSGEALPTDISDLEDGGTRTQLGFQSRLTLRDDTPLGLAFGVRVNDINYADLPVGSGLADRTTVGADMTGRFDLSQVLQARLGLTYSTTDQDGASRSDRYGINAGATLTRPNGAYSISANRSDGDGGTIATLSVGRSYVLPQTETAFALGLAQASNDTVFVTGSASLEHAFGDSSPFGSLILSANRDVTLTERSDAEIITALSLSSSYALSPTANLRLSAELGQAEEIDTGDTVTLSEVGLSFGYDFSRDWRGAANIQAQRRDPSDSTATDRTTLGISLTRTFETQY